MRVMRFIALIFALLISCSAADAAVGYNWSNYQDNTFTGASTSVAVGSTSKIGVCGTISQYDLLVAKLIIEGETTDTITPPAGWVQLGTNQNDGTSFITYWYKIAGASETCSYTFSWVNSHFMAWYLVDYNGTDHTSPVDSATITGSFTTSGTTPITATGITTGAANELVVVSYDSTTNAPTITPPTTPAGITNRINQTQESSTASTNVNDFAQATAGATGNISASGAQSVNKVFVFLTLGIKPPTGGAVTVCTISTLGAGPC